jgi:hydrogenase maturation protein HypF
MSSASEDYIGKKLEVNGIVQGVGFRPFVFQLANKHQLKGKIANTSNGVSIVVEGREEFIGYFIKNLTENAPLLANITDIKTYPQKVQNYNDFSIAKSIGQNKSRSVLISPDVSVCDDCLKELFNPEDRRYLYPFINCTNCGPRYTIIDDIPYDRPFTSMKHFNMCHLCQAEYDDPANRRFHAQPNACPECGPDITLLDNNKEVVGIRSPIQKAIELLQNGHILAIKGLGGFHLVVDACNDTAVALLRERKNREEKPFALMALNIPKIKMFAHATPDEKILLTDISRPIVLLNKKQSHPISLNVAPNNTYFGVMLPYTPLHYLLLKNAFSALVMTSGNISEEPIAIDNEEAFERLSKIADYFLIHNRDIYLRSDDSILRYEAGDTRFIRRSRGFVPVPIFLKNSLPEVLACGGELKNAICLTKNDRAFVSQHIGDLENLETDRFFRKTISHMKRILKIEPEFIAHDLHPDYLSTVYADEQKQIKKIGVQHHHAHIVSCMAENHTDGPVIGLAFDGTGFGTDGNIWGGEVLIADTAHFSRAAHLEYIPMPGSASAIREPWRMAVSCLFYAFGDKFMGMDLPVIKEIEKEKIDIVIEMIKKRINSPMTSSMGRLFDGIASMVGIRQHINFEGQAAMELEMMSDDTTTEAYDFEMISDKSPVIQTFPIIRGVAHDIAKGVSQQVIGSKFHQTIVRLFTKVCEMVRSKTGINTVAMSGGVFQNRILLCGLKSSLKDKNFKTIAQKKVPCNDGGLSLGQAVAAAAIASGRKEQK